MFASSYDRNRLFPLIVLGLSFFLISCAKQKVPLSGSRGPGNPAPGANQPQVEQPPIPAPSVSQTTAKNIIGEWTTGCQPYYDETGYYYYEDKLRFTQGQMTYSTDWYSDECTAESALPEYAYTDSGSYTLGQTEVSGVAGARNVDARFADYGEWFSIVRADVNTLYLGDDTGAEDGTSASLRPTSLRTARPFQRVSTSSSAVAVR